MSFNYPLKHWLTSLAIGPLIMIIYDTVISAKLMNDAIGMYFLFLLYGVFFSLPTLILYLFLYSRVVNTQTSNLVSKTILNFLGVVGIVVTFLLIGGSMSQILTLSYSGALIFGSLLYNIRPKQVKA